jgi:hypothetical protein
MKRASRLTTFVSGCFSFVLAIAGSTAWAAPQNQSNTPSYTVAEYNAMMAGNAEKDAQAKIKLLDNFVAQYPDSSLLPFVYTEYYRTFFTLRNYPQAVDFVDKLLALGDKVVPENSAFESPEAAAGAVVLVRLAALATRAAAYAVDCDDSVFQTPEASAKAEDLAGQGLQLLSQLPKPSVLLDADYSLMKVVWGRVFGSAQRIAEARLKGDAAICASPQPLPTKPPAPNARINRIIQDLLNEQRQSPDQ